MADNKAKGHGVSYFSRLGLHVNGETMDVGVAIQPVDFRYAAYIVPLLTLVNGFIKGGECFLSVRLFISVPRNKWPGFWPRPIQEKHGRL